MSPSGGVSALRFLVLGANVADPTNGFCFVAVSDIVATLVAAVDFSGAISVVITRLEKTKE